MTQLVQSKSPKIAINVRFLLPNKLEGYGIYTQEILSRWVKIWPEAQFYFIFDRAYDERYIFSSNITPIVLFPPARHPLLFMAWYEFSLSRFLNKLKPDLFLSMDGFLPLGYKGKKMVVIHDLAYLHFPQGIPLSHLWYYKCFQPKFAHSADQIIAVSEFSKMDIVDKFQIEPDKISVVPNACRDGFRPISSEEKIKVQLIYSEGKPYFMTLGAVHPRKNLSSVLLAFDRFKTANPELPHRLLITGRKAWKNKDLDTLWNSLKSTADIEWLGYVEDENLPAIVGAAEAMIYISLFEGFGIPILEAMACGVPVITSNKSSMPEVAGDAAILVDPLNIDEIVNAMERALSENEKAKLTAKMPANLARYDWKRSSQTLHQVAKKLLE